MKKAAIKVTKLAALFLFGVVAVALPQNPKPKPSDDLQLKIVRIQKHQLDLQVRANAAKSALDAASLDYQKSNKELGDLVDQAYKDAGLKKEEYDLDPDSLEFTKKAGLPAANTPPVADSKPAAKAETKKP